MSKTAGDRRNPNSPPPPPFAGAEGGIGRDAMDVDLGIGDDPSSWPFDPLAFVSSPPSPFFLSSPVPSMPLISSPLWLFEDRAAADAALASVAADCQGFITCTGADGTTRQLQLTVEEGGNAEDSCMIKERMTLALRNLKESTDHNLLVQVWAPVKNGNSYVLTTSGQPFVLDPHSNGLLQYRTVSVTYVFSVDGENDKLGLPGRVFSQKVPEWTPNVQYYSSKEYSRLSHALNYNVQGTLALPVFELSGQSCIGVVELIMTSPKINYSTEVDKVCKALEAVNLKSSKISDHPTFQICNESRQVVFAEILQTLTMVCEEHKLPLAQTWVPCRYRNVLTQGGGSKKSCSSFDGICMGQVCMSTTDIAFDVIDGHMWGFRDACVEHHLQKGQGVAGRSFASRRPTFCKDITQFCKTEYPLVHYARMFGLLSSFAICLQSNLTGSDDYILEFFLPPECKNFKEQRTMLKSMISLMVKCFCSLKIVSCVELQEQNCQSDVDMFIIECEELEAKSICIWTYESRFSGGSVRKSHESFNDVENVGRTPLPEQLALMDTDGEQKKKILDSNGHGSCSSFVDKNSRPPERKRGKAEKKISLEVLQQYFTGSLKDAAKSLGVCPTTMKRICRQHGISRWPSRKINKVNRSLSKLKQVIESVQETDEAFNLTSFTGPLPTSIAPISWPVNLDELDQNQRAKPPTIFCHHQEIIAQTSPNIGDESSALKESLQIHNGIQAEADKASRSSSGQGSTNSHTSEEDSFQGSRIAETQIHNQFEGNMDDLLGLRKPYQDPNSFMISAVPLSNFVELQWQEDVKVIVDSGNSKNANDLCKDLCVPLGIGFHDTHDVGPTTNAAYSAQIQGSGMVTIKAEYREDIIRFRLPFGAGLMTLKNEVARRLKLDIGTFDIKYLDDDQEWVTLTCNSDLEECMEISKRFDKNLIRLLVSDTFCNFGSSCESSGGL